jgi:hypothetical protein
MKEKPTQQVYLDSSYQENESPFRPKELSGRLIGMSDTAWLTSGSTVNTIFTIVVNLIRWNATGFQPKMILPIFPVVLYVLRD